MSLSIGWRRVAAGLVVVVLFVLWLVVGLIAGSSSSALASARGRVRIARAWQRSLVGLVSTFVCVGVLAGTAVAGDQFTLDREADSMGPVVVDQGGNGYVAWLHSVGAGDTDMFCKLPGGRARCRTRSRCR